MKKALREKLISLNGKKVKLTLTYGVVEDMLEIKFYRYQNDNLLKGAEMCVKCGEYLRALNSILDVEEI